jgi:quercetin dioxygenase-like cupin family protein
MDFWDITDIDPGPSRPVVVHSRDGVARIVAINLPAGDALDEHQVHEHAWLHVLEGRVELADDGGTTTAGPGSLAHWEPGERHAVRALEDAKIFLMLAPWPGQGHPRLMAAARASGEA